MLILVLPKPSFKILSDSFRSPCILTILNNFLTAYLFPASFLHVLYEWRLVDKYNSSPVVLYFICWNVYYQRRIHFLLSLSSGNTTNSDSATRYSIFGPFFYRKFLKSLRNVYYVIFFKNRMFFKIPFIVKKS